MMGPMDGIRILEVAEHTFVPAASAVLSDWGADVIKIEHAERGDAMRGLGKTGVMDLSKGVHVLNEHSNRGKRSLGLDLSKPEGVEVLYALAKTCDVFLTNKQPRVLDKLKIGIEDIRAQNPNIVYVRGTAFGPKGPDRDRGGYDMTAFWCRGTSASAITPPGATSITPQPGPAYGDSLGGMTIAGGIAAALLKRERTGEAPVVDVSLMATGAWAMASGIALSLQHQQPFNIGAAAAAGGSNPLSSTYQTADDRFICLVMLQAFHYWPDFCEHIGRSDLIGDSRFDSHQNLSANAAEARTIIAAEFKKKTLAQWTETFQTLKGQWAPVQNTLEFAEDPQARANGYMAATETKEGVPFELVASPVQFDQQPTGTNRAPEFNEHCDEILASIGLDEEQIIDLKVKGAVA